MWNNVSNRFSSGSGKYIYIYKYVWKEGKARKREGGLIKQMGENCKQLVNLGKDSLSMGVPCTVTETSLQVSSYIKIATKTKKLLNLAKSFHFYNCNIV